MQKIFFSLYDIDFLQKRIWRKMRETVQRSESVHRQLKKTSYLLINATRLTRQQCLNKVPSTKKKKH